MEAVACAGTMAAVGTLLVPTGPVAMAAAAAVLSDSGSTMLDLDPPFRPLIDRYIALLPPRVSGAGKLLLASSRWGDVVGGGCYCLCRTQQQQVLALYCCVM